MSEFSGGSGVPSSVGDVSVGDASVVEPAQGGGAPAPRRRMMSVEVLRLVAILGVAVFHTFLPSFDVAEALGPNPPDPSTAMGVLACSRAAMWGVTAMMFLGAWGNHVFFMISGYFLIPRMAADTRMAAASRSFGGGYWRRQCRASVRRAVKIVTPVVVYECIVLAVNRWIVPIGDAGTVSSLTVGMEFIWLYLAFVVLAPAAAWLVSRMTNRLLAVSVCALIVVVYLLNGYVAVQSGGIGVAYALTDWRKLMGAVTYATSFVAAGATGWLVSASDRFRRGLRRCRWGIVLAALGVLAFALSAVAVCGRTYALARMLSFKSTSLLSFLAAFAALMLAMRPALSGDGNGADGVPTGALTGALTGTFGGRASDSLARSVRVLTSGILGFYIVQSLISSLWRHWSDMAMLPILAKAGAAGLHTASHVGWMALWYVSGMMFSLVFVVVMCAADGTARVGLRRLRRAVSRSAA